MENDNTDEWDDENDGGNEDDDAQLPIIVEFPYTYTLRTPTDVPGKAGIRTLTNVTIQKPKGKHVVSMDRKAGNLAQTVQLIASLCGLTYSEALELDLADIWAIQAVVAPFLPMLGGRGKPTI